jgi:predicted ATPase/DNA-binding XRE family transcriptional regulator
LDAGKLSGYGECRYRSQAQPDPPWQAFIQRGVTFGATLRELRDAAGLTQEELASRAGLTAKAVSALERGARKRPYPHTVRALAEALDLSDDERAVLIEAVPRRDGDVPSPEAAATTSQSTLPTSLTPLLGREREVEEIVGLLRRASVRLLTLTGPGGIGKTRLSIEAAQKAGDHFPDGVAFIGLAPLADAALVVPTIAQTLGLREIEGRSAREALYAYLKDKRLLLVLDNLEHLLEVVPEVISLLEGCPDLTVLATSRAPLRVRGEQEYPVGPLRVPDPTRTPLLQEVSGAAAVELFVERARAASPSFDLTDSNAAAVAAICWRLDGLPLALELAAARARFLGPTALLSRLDRALEAGGARDLPERQRTMRATLDWSHDLLHEPEKELFRRLSVFAGGWTLEAAEAVGEAEEVDGEDILALLGNLVEQSLVVAEGAADGSVRYGMLEPVRQYALEKLEESGEAEVRRRHALWYTWFAGEAEKELAGPDQGEWFDRLETEHDNLRTALLWSLEGNEPDTGLRLAAALWRMWNARGYMQEGRGWLERALSSAGGLPSPERARALNGAGVIAYQQGDLHSAKELFEKSIEMGRALGDKGIVSRATGNLANFMLGVNEFTRARDLFEQSLVMDRELDDRSRIAYSLGGLADVYYSMGDIDKGVEYYEQSLALHRELDDRRSIGITLNNLGELAQLQGDLEKAEDLYKQSMTVVREIDDRWLTVHVLMTMGSLSALQNRQERAVRILAAVDALRRKIGFEFQAHTLADYERAVQLAREALTAEQFEAAWQRGSGMSLGEAARYAMSGVTPA